MRRSIVRTLHAVATAATFVACGTPPVPEGVRSSQPRQPRAEPAELLVLRAAAVVGRAGSEGEPFEVQLRSPAIGAFPCSACHGGPVSPGNRGTEEHADIQAVHPSALAARCQTCHTAADPARLALNTGETAPLDEAYRLCSQCHYAQGEDWAGGAHGKRLVSWSGRRVVLSCTGCHDPHAPAFAQRTPFRAPEIPWRGTGAR